MTLELKGPTLVERVLLADGTEVLRNQIQSEDASCCRGDGLEIGHLKTVDAMQLPTFFVERIAMLTEATRVAQAGSSGATSRR